MTDPVLDNPCWHALTGPHAPLAAGTAPVLHYPEDISPLMGLDGGAAPADLAERLPAGVTVATFTPEPLPVPAGIEIVQLLPLLQMVAGAVPTAAASVELEPLTVENGPEMLALAQLTKPGPFALRTVLMGDYLGIRDAGRLVAMTGQRLHLAGYQEVSAVCTHPDYLGRGYARLLVARVARQIIATGTASEIQKDKAVQAAYLGAVPEVEGVS